MELEFIIAQIAAKGYLGVVTDFYFYVFLFCSHFVLLCILFCSVAINCFIFSGGSQTPNLPRSGSFSSGLARSQSLRVSGGGGGARAGRMARRRDLAKDMLARWGGGVKL